MNNSFQIKQIPSKWNSLIQTKLDKENFAYFPQISLKLRIQDAWKICLSEKEYLQVCFWCLSISKQYLEVELCSKHNQASNVLLIFNIFQDIFFPFIF